MDYTVKIEVFEGPFDLLFHLIEKNEIDIYDIPMVEITEQYISYIQKLEELNLDITSEFLVMAATLIEIKSRMLLPVKVVENEQISIEELDPREELVRKLLDYKKYKVAAEELRDKEENYQKIFFKPREELIFDQEESDIFVESMEIKDLVIALGKIMKKKSKIFSDKNIREMHRDPITIEDKIKDLIQLLNQHKRLKFKNIFSSLSTKIEIITTFLALLELIKLKKVIVKQSCPYEDIIIQLRQEEVEVPVNG